MLPALPQSGDLVPFDAGYLEAAAFIDDSLQTVRHVAATESDVALLRADLSHDDVRIGILRNLLPKEDHAAVAAGVDGQWLILDDRRLALVRDTEMVGSIPKFVLDEDGTRRFVPSNRAGQGPSAGRLSPARFVRPAWSSAQAAR
jgi:hypothetical protein